MISFNTSIHHVADVRARGKRLVSRTACVTLTLIDPAGNEADIDLYFVGWGRAQKVRDLVTAINTVSDHVDAEEDA